jgi:hypothetical protein
VEGSRTLSERLSACPMGQSSSPLSARGDLYAKVTVLCFTEHVCISSIPCVAVARTLVSFDSIGKPALASRPISGTAGTSPRSHLCLCLLVP